MDNIRTTLITAKAPIAVVMNSHSQSLSTTSLASANVAHFDVVVCDLTVIALDTVHV
jgi:hypothetical protein